MLMSTLPGCKEKTADENPFFTAWETPFGVPPFDKIKDRHYKPAIEAGIARHEAEIDSIVRSSEIPTFANVIEAVETSGELLGNAYTVFSLVKAADADEQMQLIDAEITPKITAHYDNIYLNDALFKKVKAVYDQKDHLGLDPQQWRLTEKMYKRFVRAGALLTPEQKEQLRKINEQLSQLGVQFGKNLLAENNAFTLVIDKIDDLSGLPTGARQAAQQEAEARGMEGKFVFTLSKPSLIPFLSYSDKPELRKQLYEAYLQRADHGNESDNKEIVSEMARLRMQKARLLGYSTYAAFVLDDVMAATPENAYGLLDQIWTPALKLASEELAEMKQIKKQETGSDEFNSWDWWYYAEKVRKNKYALDEEMIRPYLSLDYVTSGIFQLANRLWGTSFRPVAVPYYNTECVAYEVLDKDDTHLGILYFDFFPRPGKQNGAWCGAYREPHYKDGKRVAPVVTIVANLTRPLTADQPALLNLDEAETLFHEFGHAMHSLFSQVHYKSLAEVERDFVELPSQIMENWAFEPQMLKMYAKHYQTNTDMPEELVSKIQRSRYFNQGFMTTELTAASLSDLDIHSIDQDRPIDVNAFEQEALNAKRGLMPQIAPRYRYPYFSHIFDGGYAAGYYSYLWAEVLDKDAFEAFVESGDLFNREVAASFRRNILEKGGSEDGMTLYKKFRGAEPDIKPLLRNRGLIPPEPKSDSLNQVMPAPIERSAAPAQ